MWVEISGCLVSLLLASGSGSWNFDDYWLRVETSQVSALVSQPSQGFGSETDLGEAFSRREDEAIDDAIRRAGAESGVLEFDDRSPQRPSETWSTRRLGGRNGVDYMAPRRFHYLRRETRPHHLR